MSREPRQKRDHGMLLNVLGCALVLMFIGCTSALKLAPADSETRLIKPAPGIAEIRYKLMKTENSEIGQRMVAGRRSYLVDFYRQTQDPYFGTERWSADCLKKNQIDGLVETREATSFRARLTADEELKTGSCSVNSIEVQQLTGYCVRTGTFYEIVLRGDAISRASFICPDSINY